MNKSEIEIKFIFGVATLCLKDSINSSRYSGTQFLKELGW